jgi:hypothetical protein
LANSDKDGGCIASNLPSRIDHLIAGLFDQTRKTVTSCRKNQKKILDKRLKNVKKSRQMPVFSGFWKKFFFDSVFWLFLSVQNYSKINRTFYPCIHAAKTGGAIFFRSAESVVPLKFYLNGYC